MQLNPTENLIKYVTLLDFHVLANNLGYHCIDKRNISYLLIGF